MSRAQERLWPTGTEAEPERGILIDLAVLSAALTAWPIELLAKDGSDDKHRDVRWPSRRTSGAGLHLSDRLTAKTGNKLPGHHT